MNLERFNLNCRRCIWAPSPPLGEKVGMRGLDCRAISLEPFQKWTVFHFLAVVQGWLIGIIMVSTRHPPHPNPLPQSPHAGGQEGRGDKLFHRIGYTLI